jgi:glucoside 3-dehydrogenase (cytochrome c) hitch-hiker subunit
MAIHRVSRRSALQTLAAGVGGASVLWIDNLRILAQEHSMEMRTIESSQTDTWKPQVLSARQFATTGVLVELIIPATDTPGARALQVDRYVDSVLASATVADRARFLAGLEWLDARSRALFRKDFSAATPAEQTELLTRASTGREGNPRSEFFTAAKMLTITGYYSTEAGLRQELGDDGRMVLGAFEGCTHKEHGGSTSA